MRNHVNIAQQIDSGCSIAGHKTRASAGRGTPWRDWDGYASPSMGLFSTSEGCTIIIIKIKTFV